MKKVSILVLNEAVLASIVDPRTIFLGVNDFFKAAGKPPLFKLQLVGLSRQVKLHGGMCTIHADSL